MVLPPTLRESKLAGPVTDMSLKEAEPLKEAAPITEMSLKVAELLKEAGPPTLREL